MTAINLTSYCVKCGGDRNHISVHTETISGSDDYQCSVIHRLIKCLGCDEIYYRYEFHDYEAGWYEGEDEYNYPQDIKIYPKYIDGHREIDGLHFVPETVRKIYNQTISAIKEDARILAGLGLRGTIEAICNDRNVSGPSLEKRITKLGTGGLISKKDVDRLHAIRFLGNDAAHEIKEPTQSQIAVALKIVEHLIAALYTLEREINGELDTTINEFNEFEILILKRLNEFSVGESVTIIRLMGNDFRRVKESINSMEDELISRISDNKFEYMELDSVSKAGDSNKDVQLYKILKIPIHANRRLPFPLSM